MTSSTRKTFTKVFAGISTEAEHQPRHLLSKECPFQVSIADG